MATRSASAGGSSAAARPTSSSAAARPSAAVRGRHATDGSEHRALGRGGRRHGVGQLGPRQAVARVGADAQVLLHGRRVACRAQPGDRGAHLAPLEEADAAAHLVGTPARSRASVKACASRRTARWGSPAPPAGRPPRPARPRGRPPRGLAVGVGRAPEPRRRPDGLVERPAGLGRAVDDRLDDGVAASRIAWVERWLRSSRSSAAPGTGGGGRRCSSPTRRGSGRCPGRRRPPRRGSRCPRRPRRAARPGRGWCPGTRPPARGARPRGRPRGGPGARAAAPGRARSTGRSPRGPTRRASGRAARRRVRSPARASRGGPLQPDPAPATAASAQHRYCSADTSWSRQASMRLTRSSTRRARSPRRSCRRRSSSSRRSRSISIRSSVRATEVAGSRPRSTPWIRFSSRA